MANTYKVIDEKNWERAMHCAVFRNSIEPAFCVTFEVDVTSFLEKIRQQNLSFTLSMVYAVCKCANEIETFRYRFLDGQVVLFDRIDTAFTYLNKETELFKVVNVPMADTLEEYVKSAAKIAMEQKEYFMGPLGNDVFQCSPMPFLTYTHISQIQAKRIMPHLCLIGENIMRKTAERLCLYLYRRIIPLLTEYILVSLQKNYRNT